MRPDQAGDRSATTPVLEVGGTHVTAALVRGPELVQSVRLPLDADGSASSILDEIAAAAERIEAPPRSRWGVAIPGPFDYDRGIGRFHNVGKFDALAGIDVRQGLRQRGLSDVCFVNDADAFGLGEDAWGAGAAHRVSVCLTLGTGVGSAWIRDGACIHHGDAVPPAGSAHRIVVDGIDLEDRVSRRAIRRAWHEQSGRADDVDAIARLALGNDTDSATARQVFASAYQFLAHALSPYLKAFEPTAIVVGGSIAASWQLLVDWFAPALTEHGIPAGLTPAQRPEDAALLGAAL